MDKHWDRYDHQVSPEVMERIRKEQRQAEARLWPPIEFPLRLSDALKRLTKDDLSEIRSNLSVRKASSLNKTDLAALLSTKIPALLPDVVRCMDDER